METVEHAATLRLPFSPLVLLVNTPSVLVLPETVLPNSSGAATAAAEEAAAHVHY